MGAAASLQTMDRDALAAAAERYRVPAAVCAKILENDIDGAAAFEYSQLPEEEMNELKAKFEAREKELKAFAADEKNVSIRAGKQLQEVLVKAMELEKELEQEKKLRGEVQAQFDEVSRRISA